MSYTKTHDPYHNPEYYGLETVGSIDWDNGGYEFNLTVVWRHTETGALYIASDSGCSCPSPFEGLESNDVDETLASLERVKDLAELETILEGHNASGGDYRAKYSQGDIIRCANEIRDLLDEARKMGAA